MSKLDPQALENLCINCDPDPSRRMPFQQANSATPECQDGCPPPWPTRCGWKFLRSSIPRTRTGRIRDRFVLSAGHGSRCCSTACFTSTGYALPLSEIKRFRQWGSMTPGHPGTRPHARRRSRHGSFGQGFGNAGRHGEGSPNNGSPRASTSPITKLSTISPTACAAMATSWKASRMKPPRSPISICNLGKLILMYDQNRITLAGMAPISLSPKTVGKRRQAYGWQAILHVEDGNDTGRSSNASDRTGPPGY